MKYFISLFLLIFFIAPESLAQQVDEDLVSRADSLYDAFEEKEALSIYEEILEDHPENYKALWRTSFLYSRIGNRLDDEDQQEEFFKQARDLAEKALEINPDGAWSNFVMAVAMGRMALISGAKDRVEASREIKKYANRAIEIDAEHAGAWHVLGVWHYQVANLNFLERTAARTLFGGLPDASNEEAIEALERAIELTPQYVLYHHDLAMAYEEAGNESAAIEACETALQKENISPDDEKLKNECREWINDWQ